MAKLQHIARCSAHPEEECSGWHMCKKAFSCNMLEEAEKLIIRNVHQEVYADEFSCITAKRDLSHHSPLIKLNPSIDSSGLLRIGGHLNQA